MPRAARSRRARPRRRPCRVNVLSRCRRPDLPGAALRVLRWEHAMDALNESVEGQAEAPQIPAEPAPPIQSRFLFVDVAALRAKQLRRGARLRFDGDPAASRKAERLAMEEVRRGLVQYDFPPPKPPRAEEQR